MSKQGSKKEDKETDTTDTRKEPWAFQSTSWKSSRSFKTRDRSDSQFQSWHVVRATQQTSRFNDAVKHEKPQNACRLNCLVEWPCLSPAWMFCPRVLAWHGLSSSEKWSWEITSQTQVKRLNRQALEKFLRRTCNTQICFWQCAGAKRKNKARSVQMLWHLRFCPEQSAFFCFVNISDKVQGANPNTKFAPSTSGVIGEGWSTIGCSSHFLRSISICIASSKVNERDRDRENIVYEVYEDDKIMRCEIRSQSGPTCRPASAALVSASRCDRP